jgi:hypothetical protein
MTGVLRERKEGLLVVRRLSKPAVLPGVRRIIFAVQRVFVMSSWDRPGVPAAASRRSRRGNRRARGRPPARLGARGHGSRGLPPVRAVLRTGPQHVPAQLADAPVGGDPVVLWLGVRRFFCANPGCKAVTFAEQFEGLTSPRARRTPPLARMLTAIGLALAGGAGTRLASELNLPASRVGMLRLVMALPDPEAGTVTILSTDDFAFRRGRHTAGSTGCGGFPASLAARPATRARMPAPWAGAGSSSPAAWPATAGISGRLEACYGHGAQQPGGGGE